MFNFFFFFLDFTFTSIGFFFKLGFSVYFENLHWSTRKIGEKRREKHGWREKQRKIGEKRTEKQSKMKGRGRERWESMEKEKKKEREVLWHWVSVWVLFFSFLVENITEWWVPNVWGLGNWGILSDEWRKKKNPNNP